MDDLDPKVWWRSKVLWMALSVVVSNVLALAGAVGGMGLGPEATAAVLALWNSILGVLAVVFRWTASQPLSFSAPPPKVRR